MKRLTKIKIMIIALINFYYWHFRWSNSAISYFYSFEEFIDYVIEHKKPILIRNKSVFKGKE